MLSTKNDLARKKRAAMVKLLNERLVDLIDLRLSTKQAHWNVRGPNFIALHEMFDSFVPELDGYADDVAERLAALGGLSEATSKVVAKTSSLKAYPTDITAGTDHVEALAEALAAAGKLIRAAIDEADDGGDADTADLFTGISRGLDKKLWFVEAHQQAKS
jgi:starvation-inducible DNA-binding protein